MNTKNKLLITRENGEQVEALAPVIVSASRSTDIPGFYYDWFLHRLKSGYCAWTNPFNGVRNYVSFQNTRLIVFWSKNPKHLLDKNGLLDYINEKGINSYVQFTLNDYVDEKLECGVPPVEDRISTFKALVEKLGFGRVIWRFDPLLLTDNINVDDLLRKIKNIGDQLKGYTEKLVFSYADIAAYMRVKANLKANNINYREFTTDDMVLIAAGLQQLNQKWGYTLATCGEKINIEEFGIVHNKCVDDDLMIKYFSNDTKLMDFLGVEFHDADLFSDERIVIKKKNNKDKGQRQFCGCIVSKDIGEYNTCAHLCEYCYANSSKERAIQHMLAHNAKPFGESIY